MSSRSKRRESLGSARSRRTPSRPAQGAGPSIPTVPLLVLVAALAVAGLVAYLIWQQGQSASDSFGEAARVEADDDPTLPGEWVNLPEIYGDDRGPAHYGNRDGPSTAPHVSRAVDYSEQGLPPVGGPHWGSGSCTADPDASPPFCGPVPAGIYRKPWPAASLVHTMEHSGFVIWYNTTDQSIIAELEDLAQDNDDKNLVLTPFPEMEEETIAITVWSRRDKFPVSEYDRERLENFIDRLKCRFKAEDPLRVC